jgi:iron complex outermembrane receptor protein
MRCGNPEPSHQSDAGVRLGGRTITRLLQSTRRLDLGATALGLCLVAAPADAIEPISEEAFFAEIPAVYSATRLDQNRREIPASVSVITREMIEASPALEIPDLLRLVPGFQVAHVNGAIFAPTYHGSADQVPRRMEVMIDGRSVYQPTISVVEWSTLGLAIDDIERIEVVRGPNSASFGNNAVRGSINIVTRQPFFLHGPYARVTVGDIGTGIGVLRYGGRLGTADASLTLQYREDDGFDDVDDHKRIADARFHATYQASVRDALDIQAGIADGETGAWGWPDDPYNAPRDRTVRSNYLNVSWLRTLGTDHSYRLSLSLNSIDHSDLFQAPSVLNPGETFTFGAYDADTRRYDLEFEHHFKPRDELRVVWGAGARYDRLETVIALGENSPATESSWRLFGNAEWRPVPKWVVNAGLSTSFREVSDDYTSPRIGVNWLFAPDQMLRASASRSHYVGTLYQQYANYHLIDTANPPADVPYLISRGPGLEAEEMTSYELGYVRVWPRRGLELDLKVFREEFRNEGYSERVLYEIDDPENPGEKIRYTDLPMIWGSGPGQWTTDGAEAELRYRSPRGTALSLAYAYSTVEGWQPRAADQTYEPIGRDDYDDTVPRHTLSAQLSQRFADDWYGTLALYHVDDMRWRGLGDPIDGYTRLDLKLGKAWRLGARRLGFDLIVHNLLDDPYIEFEESNRFERRAYLQFRVE